MNDPTIIRSIVASNSSKGNKIISSMLEDVKEEVNMDVFPANRPPPRPQSSAKQAAILAHLTSLLSQDIIEKSSSAYYSQVLMVPKPDGQFRLCIDYPVGIDCITDASWPIPDINEMLRRIGTQKPTIFGSMDLIQGYH